MTKINKTNAAAFKLFAAAAVAALLVAMPKAGAEGIKKGLELCLGTVVPSLFAFTVTADYIASCLAGVKRGGLAAVAAVALCGGFASGAAAVNRLYAAGSVDKPGAEKLLAALTSAGPTFVIGAVGAGMWNSVRLGWMMLLSIVLADAAVFLLLGCFRIKIRAIPNAPKPSLTSSIACGVRVTALLCGSVILASCIGEYLSLLPLSAASAAAVRCAIEVSGGCAAAAGASSPYLAAAALSGLSISVIMQLSSIVSKSGLSIKKLVLSRAIHIPLTLLALKLLLSLSGGEQAVFADNTGVKLFSVSPLFSFFLFMCCAAAVLQKQK